MIQGPKIAEGLLLPRRGISVRWGVSCDTAMEASVKRRIQRRFDLSSKLEWVRKSDVELRARLNACRIGYFHS